MKKQKMKLLSIILIIMILLNTIMPLVQAQYVHNEKYSDGNIEDLVKEEDVDKDDCYAIFELTSDKSTYNVDDEITISFKLKEASFEYIRMIHGYYVYDDEFLEIQGDKNDAFELPNSSYTKGAEGKNYFQITNNNDENGIKEGETICTIKFKAKKDSSNQTNVWMENIDITGVNSEGDDENPLVLLNQANEPVITLGGQALETNVKKHSIEITKVDENLETIKETEAIFKLTTSSNAEPVIKEGQQGITKFENLEMPTTSSAEKKIIYTIVESKAPDGYQANEEPINLTVTFGDDGTVTNAKNGTSNVTVENDNDNNVIKLKIQNKKKTEVRPTSKFTLNVEKTDGDRTITEGKAMFKIVLANNYELYKDTENGKFSYEIQVPEDVNTDTTYTYKLEEVTPPDGYELNSQEITLNVKFKHNGDGTYSIDTATKTTGDQATLEKTDKALNVKVTNNKVIEEQKFQIVLTKIDESGTTISSSPAKFIITSPSETTKVGSTENGTMTIQGIIPSGDLEADGYIYTIQEITAPIGYKLNSNIIKLNIKFTGEVGARTIDSATIVEGSQANVTATVGNQISLSVKNEKQPQKFTIKINKVDEQGNPIKKAGTLFEIKNPINNETKYIQTDANGLATYTSQAPLIAGTKNFTIKERVAPDGYILDDSEINLPLVFTNVEDKVNLTAHNIDSEKIQVNGDVTDNTITLNFKNEKEKVQVQQKYFKLIVNKKDLTTGESINQKGILFKIVEQGKDDSIIKETNTSGIAEFSLPMPKTKGQVTYTLTEESAPSGYERTAEKMPITAIFTEEDGIIKLNDITVGTSQYIEKVEPVEDNEAQVNVKNKLIPVPEHENYQIVIQKIDSEDETNIEQKDIFFKITDPTGVASYLPTDEHGRITIEYKMPTATGSHTFKIEEVKAPTGYNLYAKEQTVTVNFRESEGKILINDATSSGEKIDNPTVYANQVQVKISNDKPPKEILENYTLKIDTFGTDIQKNIQESNVLYSLTDESGNVSYIVTDETGVATFIGIKPKTEKNINLVLKQLSSPTNYIKNPKDMHITLEFQEDAGKIKLSNITVNTDEGIDKVGEIRR